jgi:hypothetical protein
VIAHTLGGAIRVAFHPAPQTDLIVGNWNVPVRVGALGWMDSAGQRHEF